MSYMEFKFDYHYLLNNNELAKGKKLIRKVMKPSKVMGINAFRGSTVFSNGKTNSVFIHPK